MLVLPAWKYALWLPFSLLVVAGFAFCPTIVSAAPSAPTLPSVVTLLPTPAADPNIDTTTPLTVTALLLPPLEADTPEAHLRLGLLSFADGRIDLATAHLFRATALRQDWPDGRLFLSAINVLNDPVFAQDLIRSVMRKEPSRVDAHALYDHLSLRMATYNMNDPDYLIMAQDGISETLSLAPDLADALAMQALADILDAAIHETQPVRAVTRIRAGLTQLQNLSHQGSDYAGGYLTMFAPLLDRKVAASPADLEQIVAATTTWLAEHPDAYADLARRGQANYILAGALSHDPDRLAQADADLLRSLTLARDHMRTLADPAAGPLQAAAIYWLYQANYLSGALYLDEFYSSAPGQHDTFTQLLITDWSLLDLLHQIVKDPITFDAAFSPDGTKIATMSESDPAHLRIWDAATGEQRLDLTLPMASMTDANRELCTGQTITPTVAGSVVFSPEGDRLLVSQASACVRVIDATTGEVLLELAHAGAVSHAIYSPNGRQILTADPVTMEPILWDAVTGKEVRRFTGAAVRSTAFSPDGKHITGYGETVVLWDAASGKLGKTFPGYASRDLLLPPAFSPDGRRLAVPGAQLVVFDVVSARETLTIYTAFADAFSVQFSPDGKRIVATLRDGTARVWDAKTGAPLAMVGHALSEGAVHANALSLNSAAFSPDSKRIVTTGYDGRYRVWDATTGQELQSVYAASMPDD